MSIDVKCAVCGKRYKVGDDKKGRQFHCRECGEPIRVGRALSPGQKWIEDGDRSVLQTRSGLTLLYWGLITFFIALISPLFASLLLIRFGGLFAGAGVTAVLMALSLSMIFIGLMRCIAVTERSEAKGMIIIAVGTQAIGAAQLLTDTLAPGTIPGPLGLLLSLGGPISVLSLLTFMKRLGSFIGREDLAGRAQILFFTCLGAFGLIFVTFLFMMASFRIRIIVARIGAPILMICGLIVFVMFVNLTRSLALGLKPQVEPLANGAHKD